MKSDLIPRYAFLICDTSLNTSQCPATSIPAYDVTFLPVTTWSSEIPPHWVQPSSNSEVLLPAAANPLRRGIAPNGTHDWASPNTDHVTCCKTLTTLFISIKIVTTML